MAARIKNTLKAALRALAPKRFDALMTARADRHGQWVMAQQGVPAIAAALVERHGTLVQSGPFAGMQYVAQSAGSSFVPKLLGSYESELHGIVERVVATPYDTVIDVGSAEGFYVVGLARRMGPQVRIYAFDINPKAQGLCRDLARLNGVDGKIHIGGFCDPAVLQATLHGRSLLICDCEGYETELLQLDLVPALAGTDILVELHDCLKPGVTPVIRERFAGTHDILLLDSAERNPAEYPALHFLSPPQQGVALSEFRNGPQQWAFLTPKTNAPAA